MMAKRTIESQNNLCPLVSDTRVRLASNSQTDAIKNNFPKGIARPALRALVAAGFSKLEELAVISEQAALHGMGPKAVKTLKQGLQAKGLALKKQSSAKQLEKE